MELLGFDRVDLVEWIARVEQYFNIQEMTEEYKIPMTFVSMEGQAGYWFKWLKRRMPNITWEGLRE